MKALRTVLFRSAIAISLLMAWHVQADERRFGYDENGNLIQASVLYDSSGNLIPNSGLFYEYNDANRLVRVRLGSESGQILEEYTYDYRGQRFKKNSNIHVCESGSGCEYVSYDFQGNPFPHDRKLTQTTYYIGKHYEEKLSRAMVVVDDQDTPIFRQEVNHYFANGQRVAKTTVTETVELAGDGSSTVLESSDKEFYLTNHLGSTDVVLSEDSDVIADLDYYPFGEIRKPSKESYSYTGKEKDHKTNNYYYEARYYDAGMRTFTQADTIVPELYDPQSLNRYAYVRNNPLKFVDPTGHRHSRSNRRMKNRSARFGYSLRPESDFKNKSDYHSYLEQYQNYHNNEAQRQINKLDKRTRIAGGVRVIKGATTAAGAGLSCIVTGGISCVAVPGLGLEGGYDMAAGVSMMKNGSNFIEPEGNVYQAPGEILRSKGYDRQAEIVDTSMTTMEITTDIVGMLSAAHGIKNPTKGLGMISHAGEMGVHTYDLIISTGETGMGLIGLLKESAQGLRIDN